MFNRNELKGELRKSKKMDLRTYIFLNNLNGSYISTLFIVFQPLQKNN